MRSAYVFAPRHGTPEGTGSSIGIGPIIPGNFTFDVRTNLAII
jgi:hypothetical protein